MNKSKLFNLIFKVLVSTGLILTIYFNVDKTQLVDTLRRVDLIWVPLIICLIILNYLVSSLRWKKLILGENTTTISINYLATLYFVGSFFNNFMPTSIGGDVYKVYKLGKKTGNMSEAFASTFMERFTGVVMLFLLAFTGLFAYLGYWTILFIVWVLLLIYFGYKITKWLAAKNNKIANLLIIFSQYKNKRNLLFYVFITSLLVQLFSILTQYVTYISLGQILPVFYALMVFPIINLAGFFIPSLNGVGVQDALYIVLFKAIGVPVEVSLSASILYHIFRLAVSLFGGVLYALGKAE